MCSKMDGSPPVNQLAADTSAEPITIKKTARSRQRTSGDCKDMYGLYAAFADYGTHHVHSAIARSLHRHIAYRDGDSPSQYVLSLKTRRMLTSGYGKMAEPERGVTEFLEQTNIGIPSFGKRGRLETRPIPSTNSAFKPLTATPSAAERLCVLLTVIVSHRRMSRIRVRPNGWWPTLGPAPRCSCRRSNRMTPPNWCASVVLTELAPNNVVASSRQASKAAT